MEREINMVKDEGPIDPLLQENAAIFSILPLMILGLFHRESHEVVLQKFLQDQISIAQELDDDRSSKLQAIISQVNEALTAISKLGHSEKSVLVIDENKSVLLSLTFGRTFSDALDILSNPDNIEANVLCEDSTAENIQHVVSNYMQGKFESGDMNLPIAVKVNQKKSTGTTRNRLSKNKDAEIRERISYLELEQMLHNVGLTITDTGELAAKPKIVQTQFVPPPDHSSEAIAHELKLLQLQLDDGIATTSDLYLVDLKSWYCSCEEYQACYVPTEPENNAYAPDYNSPDLQLQMVPVDRLIAKNLHNSITHLFRGPQPHAQTNHLSTLPICPHLLAVVIAAVNSTTNHKFFTLSSLSDPRSWIT